MLIMPTTSKNFQALADRIANDFLTKGISIEDGVVEAAKAQDMNPEEVKRLVEKCNTAATVLFLKSSEDKKAIFKLAKYEDVVARTHPVLEDDEELDEGTDSSYNADEETTKTASCIFPTTRKTIILEKTSGCIGNNCPTPAPVIPPAPTPRNIFDIKNKVNQLKQTKVATEMRLQKWLDELIGTYQYKTAEEFNKFASDATSLYGKELLPLLKYASEYLKHPLKLEKVAYVDTDSYNNLFSNYETLSKEMAQVRKNDTVLSELEKFANIDRFSTF